MTQVSNQWQILRSDIYIRDKGMCWICNTFVPLDDYELGHIIDRCNGGHDDYDNLAVMHKACNLSKPYHQTLEEAVKWKLTAFMLAIQQARGIASQFPKVHYPHTKRAINYPHLEINYTNPSRTLSQQEAYDEQVKRIKPSTICWKQGNPQSKGQNFAPMYRLLPPPYRQEDMFTMRETPLGYVETKIDGKGSIRKSLQVIGGEMPNDIDTTIHLGHLQIHISSQNGIPNIIFKNGVKSNVGERSQTIGMGKGQIPIEVWNEAKAQGISLETFKARYTNKC